MSTNLGDVVDALETHLREKGYEFHYDDEAGLDTENSRVMHWFTWSVDGFDTVAGDDCKDYNAALISALAHYMSNTSIEVHRL